MDPVTLLAGPTLAGGLVVALVVFWANRRLRSEFAARLTERHDPTTDVVNMARIRVAGVGGLGLVAMAVAVAFLVPRIGQELAWGLGLGIVLAVVLVVRGRRRGPLPSSGMRPGANTVLSIDTPGAQNDEPRGTGDLLRHRVRPA